MARLKGESHPKAKLTNVQVVQIRNLYKSGFSAKVIAKNFKISTWNVYEIIKNHTWTHI